MIKNKNIIVFSDDWGRFPSSCQHLISRFIPDNRILWVNTVGLRSPQANQYDIKRIIEKLLSWFKPAVKKENHLTVINPVLLPYNQINWVRKFNQRAGLRSIRKAMKKLQFRDPIVLTTVPNAVDFVGALGEALSIYYCVDDFSEWPGMDKFFILEMESELKDKVGLYAATSEKLYERRPKNIPSLYLPHGVDYGHYEPTRNSCQELHDVSGNRPVLCYFGVIDERLDEELIETVFRKRPLWKGVFVGPKMSFPDKLKKLPNISLMGPVTYKQLPYLLREMDILILPYKINRLTEAINPLKLRECMATGKPVVTVKLPETEKYSNAIFIAENQESFLEALDKAAFGLKHWNAQKQLKAILNESWENRAQLLSEEIEKLGT